MITLVSLSLVLFVATHVDDLFLLLSLYAERRTAKLAILLGQYLGVTALLAAGLLCSRIAVAIPASYLRWLGLIPILLGLQKLVALFVHSEEPAGIYSAQPLRHSQTLGVAAVTIASGGDNLGVYLPLFANWPWHNCAVLILVFLVMTAAWCFFAHWLAHHRSLRAPVAKWGAWLFPVVLLILGLRILFPAH
jgi:cadmium resistance protein CadD (predicted permease)